VEIHKLFLMWELIIYIYMFYVCNRNVMFCKWKQRDGTLCNGIILAKISTTNHQHTSRATTSCSSLYINLRVLWEGENTHITKTLTTFRHQHLAPWLIPERHCSRWLLFASTCSIDELIFSVCCGPSSCNIKTSTRWRAWLTHDRIWNVHSKPWATTRSASLR
jgi:hypothetical protein